MRNKRASILIFVMWTLIVLSLLSIAVSHDSAADIKLMRYESENIKSLCLLKAGITKMITELNKDRNNYNSLNEDWGREKEFRLGENMVRCRTYDEEARFNLNSPDLNKEHLIILGLDDDISQSLLDYRAKKEEDSFEFMEELFLIDEMTRNAYLKLKDCVTVYRGRDQKVNINTAGENILRTVLGDDSLLINKIIAYRGGNDAKICTEDDGIFTEDNFGGIFENFGIAPKDILNYRNLFKVKSEVFRIVIDVSFSEDKSRARRIVAIADRQGKIHYWKEE